MVHKPKSDNSSLVLLRRAGVLGIISEMLDLQTLETVIYHIDEFCRSITMALVERTLKELFGSRWRQYYDAYVCYAYEDSDSTKQDLVSREPCSNLDSSRGAAVKPLPWGLGYELCFPPETLMINGCVVLTAIKTLNSIAQNCKNYDYSFIPGEPSECGINRVSFIENGRLVWIEYRPESYDWRNSGFDLDILNLEHNFSSDAHCSQYARLDGQIPLQDSAPAREAVALVGTQETYPTKVHGFQYELWDIGADPHPRCLWSSLWTAIFSKSRLNVSDRVFPLTTFELEHFDGLLIPSMRGVQDPFDDVVDLQTERSCFRHGQSQGPIRFVKCVSSFAVIDLIRLEPMQFHGVCRLQNSRLSRGSEYVGAVARVKAENGEVGDYLAIWRPTLPKPSLVWENGVKLLCDRCDWFIEHDWLIVACSSHGNRAYCLTSPMPNATDVTSLVPARPSGEDLVFRVCGADQNVIFCELPKRKSYWFIKFRERNRGEWSALPIYLTSHPSAKTPPGATVLGFNACSHIHKVGTRYCLNTSGDLFGLDLVDVPSADKRISVEPVDTKRLKVLAIWESPVSGEAIIGCYDADGAEPILILMSIDPLGEQRLLTTSDEPIRYQDVLLTKFSPDGSKLFVQSRDKELGGWIITITKNPTGLEHALRIYKLPRLVFAAKDRRATKAWPELIQPVFVAKNTIAIIRKSIGDDDYEPENDDSATSTTYEMFDSRVILVRIDDNGSDICCSSIGSSAHDERDGEYFGGSRRYYPRWVDVLQESPRAESEYGSITYDGLRAALSPGHRFLLYSAERDSEHCAMPQIEMCDLKAGARKRPNDVRRSWNSFSYCLRLRKDFRRDPTYWADLW